MYQDVRALRRVNESKAAARRMQPGRSTRRIILDADSRTPPRPARAPRIPNARLRHVQKRRVSMRAENAETVNCPSCGATLIGGLRFCRMCGYRLGEGLDEYVPTQRLDPNAAQPFAPPRPSTDPFVARQTWGAAPVEPMRP